MDGGNVASEGLFLKNYLGTISAVSRPRTDPHSKYKSSYLNSHQGGQPKRDSHTLENGAVNHPRIIHETIGKRENAYSPANEGHFQASEVGSRAYGARGSDNENDGRQDKKKERKWTLGGFFKRKPKKDADDTSEEDSADDVKGGFLARRRSKRERRKTKARSVTNGFDVVIPQTRDHTFANGLGTTVEQLWSGSAKSPERPAGTGNGTTAPLRFIHRHQTTNSYVDAPRPGKDFLQIPKNPRREVGHIGDSLDGKKNRKEVLARAQAKRDLICDESSSDECESYHSSSSLNRLGGDGHRRPRRTDRQGKRYSSRDDLIPQKDGDLRIVKSDFEANGHPFSTGRPVVPRTQHFEAKCHEPSRFNSTSSSPNRSPRARQKQNYGLRVQNAYPTSTFPPGVHQQQLQQPRPATSVTMPVHRKHETNGRQPSPNGLNRQWGARATDGGEFLQNLQRSISAAGSAGQTVDQDCLPLATGYAKEKSLSYDQDIHRAPYFYNRLSENSRQVPARWSVMDGVRSMHSNARRQRMLEMYRNEAARPNGHTNELNGHQMSPRAYENYIERSENRTDSSPCLSTQPGSFPQQPTQNVQRSASGNSFSNSLSFGPNRSNSYQHIPTYVNRRNFGQETSFPIVGSAPQFQAEEENAFYWSRVNGDNSANADDASRHRRHPNQTSTFRYSPTKPNVSDSSSILRYYADQNPRSRNPIHVTCNPASPAELSYLSDSQVPSNGPRRENGKSPTRNASDFWRLKDQELMLKSSLAEKKNQSSNKQSAPFGSVRLSPSERAKPTARVQSVVDGKYPGSAEDINANKITKIPPEPPVRRLSKQEVLAKLQKCERLKSRDNDPNGKQQNDARLQNGNLDDALNELEIIYNSLRLKDDDLVDRAERRDLPVFRPNEKKECSSVSVRDKIQNFYAEADVPVNHTSKNGSDGEQANGYQRAVPLRRSAVSDKVGDDMAFRRLNSKDRNDPKKFPSPSYLRSSPALSPTPTGNLPPRKESPVDEPDVTFDDVVFRNIRHANSTLKIQDPQPPFGIPIGVITPAANSDYLHATPTDRFRPTFAPSKTPDIVKDDLAFRNLRKDNRTLADGRGNDQTNLMKKRAVRSLSANIYNIMQKEDNGQRTSNGEEKSDGGKTQSLTDLTNGTCGGKQALEKRLKELKDEKNLMRAEFFEPSQEQKPSDVGNGSPGWMELADLKGDLQNVRNSVRRYESMAKGDGHRQEESEKAAERKSLRSPIVELSKYPAAAPASTFQGNPFKETQDNSAVDEEQLESLLSALAIEAKNTSKDLERQLDELGLKEHKPVSGKETSTAMTEVKTTEVAGSPPKEKRRRNLSLSNVSESKMELRPTGSLERRHSKRNGNARRDDRLQPFELPRRQKPRDGEPKPRSKQAEPKTKRTPSEPEFSPEPEVLLESTIEDLSQILQEVEADDSLQEKAPEVEEKKDGFSVSNDMFQEVYEYNCNLPVASRRRSQAREEVAEVVARTKRSPETETKQPEEASSDVEQAFERLHQEVSPGRGPPKDFALVDDLIADMKSALSEAQSGCGCARDDRKRSSEDELTSNRTATSSSGSNSGEGEVKKSNLRTDVWLACSYALAFAFQLQEIDPMTAVGIVLAVISIAAILIL